MPQQKKSVDILVYLTDFMNEGINNKSNNSSEKLIDHVGTSLLNGLGNLLEITSHEAKEDISGDEMPPVMITNERRKKVKNYTALLESNEFDNVCH